jgi:hypothetical protein
MAYPYGSPYDEEDKRSALTQGLLAAGLAALGARKGSEYNAFAQAGLLGLGGYGRSLENATEARDRKAQREMQAQQYAQQQAEWQRAQQQRAQMEGAQRAATLPGAPGMPAQEADSPGGTYMPPTPGTPGGFDRQKYGQLLETIDPMKGLAYQQAQQQLMAKDTPYDKPKPEHYTPASVAEYARTRNPAVLVPVTKPDASPVGKINPSDFTAASVAAFLSSGGNDYNKLVPIDKRPVSSVKINNYTETEQDKAIGKARGELYSTLNQGAGKAQARITALSAIESLMSGVETSALTPIGNKFASYAKAAGINIDPNLPAKEAAQSFMNQLALESRSTAEGGGMPGAMSDKDREFLISMNPNMGQTTQGRQILINVQKRMAQRQKELAQWAREYRTLNNGTFDEGFQDFATAKAEQKPLFADMYGAGTQPATNRREAVGRIGAGGAQPSYRFDKNGNQY